MQYKQKVYALSTVFKMSVLERATLYDEQLIEIAVGMGMGRFGIMLAIRVFQSL